MSIVDTVIVLGILVGVCSVLYILIGASLSLQSMALVAPQSLVCEVAEFRRRGDVEMCAVECLVLGNGVSQLRLPFWNMYIIFFPLCCNYIASVYGSAFLCSNSSEVV